VSLTEYLYLNTWIYCTWNPPDQTGRGLRWSTPADLGQIPVVVFVFRYLVTAW